MFTRIVLALITGAASIATAWITAGAKFSADLDKKGSELSSLQGRIEELSVEVGKADLSKVRSSISNLAGRVTVLEGNGLLGRMPTGLILPWIIEQPATIPEGWAICDGKNGTPDLRGRFLRGSAIQYAGDTGGTARHSHEGLTDGEVDGHRAAKTKDGGAEILDNFGGQNWAHKHKFSTAPAEHSPPYVDVVFIIRLRA